MSQKCEHTEIAQRADDSSRLESLPEGAPDCAFVVGETSDTASYSAAKPIAAAHHLAAGLSNAAEPADTASHLAAGLSDAAELADTARSAPVDPKGVSAKIAAPPASNEHVRKSMQGNKRANTKPELLMRQRLRDAGLTGYRLQWKVPGHPDIAWPGKKVALFVNGCFWHRCPHCRPSAPKSHVEYWMVKFDRNVERDARNMQALRDAGWKVHVVWECQLKKKAIDATLAELLPKLAVDLGKTLRLSSIREEDGDADRLSGSESASLESAPL